MIRLKLGAAVLVAAMAAGAAQAHSPYLSPNMFDATDRDHVTVQASFTEHFFHPDVVMKSEDFHAIGPDGAKIPLTATYFKDLAVMELPLAKTAGTWRISSGVRVGRVSKVVLKDGKWEFIEPGKPAPEGAQEMQSITTAEAYVSRGAPSDTALKATGVGLEFHPLTHPNNIGAGEAATFEALVDGKPLAGQKIAIHSADEDEHSGKPLEVTTGADGKFSIRLEHPGTYLAMTRYRISPANGAAGRSLTYTLTFDVQP